MSCFRLKNEHVISEYRYVVLFHLEFLLKVESHKSEFRKSDSPFVSRIKTALIMIMLLKRWLDVEDKK